MEIFRTVEDNPPETLQTLITYEEKPGQAQLSWYTSLTAWVRTSGGFFLCQNISEVLPSRNIADLEFEYDEEAGLNIIFFYNALDMKTSGPPAKMMIGQRANNVGDYKSTCVIDTGAPNTILPYHVKRILESREWSTIPRIAGGYGAPAQQIRVSKIFEVSIGDYNNWTKPEFYSGKKNQAIKWNMPLSVEGTSSLISTSAETLKTAIGNINHTVGNINNTLKLSGNLIDNSTPGSVIGRKRTCENEELPSTPNKMGPNLPPNIFSSSTTETGEKSPDESNLKERNMKKNGEEITDEEHTRMYNLRERKEINYAENSASDISDPYHVIILTFPAIENHTFSLFSKFIKYQAYEREWMFRPTNWTNWNANPLIITIQETTGSTLYEKIEKLFKMRNKLILKRPITEKPYAIFKNAFSDVKYEWIEKDVKTLKDASDMFSINVKGPPEKKHTVGDAK
ncbi:10274_t:CDS:10 [Acaulospora morrowiae]|uniref:10274_t:CDS:1 n=1 Tax=Acaulospora morrowiae TaxID=94023 RepID=A0A9N9A0P0_9GLOM|nr:10274_t:CDS:10 [Acaulospora morrowiae]